MHKKGQAAMEFLIVLVVIGALAYFGILNPNTLLPEKCQVQMGLNCKDHLVTTKTNSDGKILMTLENGRGSDIQIANITASTTSLGDLVNCTLDPSSAILLRNGASKSFNLTNGTNKKWCNITYAYAGSNTKLKWDIEIEWYSVATGAEYTHTASGELMAIVE